MSQTTLEGHGTAPGRSIAEYPLPQGKLVLMLEGSPPGWVEPLLKSLTQLLALPPNWDSYDGQPVDPANAWAAWQLLGSIMREDMPLPALVPTPRGGIQVEWHTRGIDLEIEIISPHRLLVSFEDAATAAAWDREVTGDWAELAAQVAKLAATLAADGNGQGRS